MTKTEKLSLNKTPRILTYWFNPNNETIYARFYNIDCPYRLGAKNQYNHRLISRFDLENGVVKKRKINFRKKSYKS